MQSTVDGRGQNRTRVSLTPGFRTHAGRAWYTLGGLKFPVTGPRPFDYQPIFWLMMVS